MRFESSMFQSSPFPKEGRYDRTPRSADDPLAVSILALPEGRALLSLQFRV